MIMQIFDSHIHLFNEKIVENVSSRKDLVQRLNLQTNGALVRLEMNSLRQSLEASGVSGGLILPTAAPMDIRKMNDRFLNIVSEQEFLHTAGTLHPDFPDNQGEITRLSRHGIRAIKLCSFSQGFKLDGSSTLKLFDLIQHHNETCSHPFFVVLDTLFRADRWFGTDPAFNTTPAGICALAHRFPAINFVGAHMGGLSAPFDEIQRHLIPCDNFYLDTSNAAHTLKKAEFVELLKRFGARHVLFGTDWPWFVHEDEIALIQELVNTAGFGPAEAQSVFYGNIARLMGLISKRNLEKQPTS